jgi:hypothetical protein
MGARVPLARRMYPSRRRLKSQFPALPRESPGVGRFSVSARLVNWKRIVQNTSHVRPDRLTDRPGCGPQLSGGRNRRRAPGWQDDARVNGFPAPCCVETSRLRAVSRSVERWRASVLRSLWMGCRDCPARATGSCTEIDARNRIASGRTAAQPPMQSIVGWCRPAAGTRYVPDLSSAAAARRRAAAPAHCMRWPRPGERLHYPDCESLLLNEVPEVVVVDHPSPPDIAAQCFRAFRCGPTDPCLVRRIAARCCRPDGLRPRLAAIGDGQSH